MITDKIRQLRNEKGYSQEFIAEKLNVSQGTYNRLENGKQDFHSSQLIQISEILGTTVGELFGEKGNYYIQNNSNVNNASGTNNFYSDKESIVFFKEVIMQLQNQNSLLLNLIEKINFRN